LRSICFFVLSLDVDYNATKVAEKRICQVLTDFSQVITLLGLSLCLLFK
jgi:hypothetical protein